MKNKIKIELTPKEFQLIDFIRSRLRFGRCEVITHAGEPQDIIIKEVKHHLDGNIKKEKLSIT